MGLDCAGMKGYLFIYLFIFPQKYLLYTYSDPNTSSLAERNPSNYHSHGAHNTVQLAEWTEGKEHTADRFALGSVGKT